MGRQGGAGARGRAPVGVGRPPRPPVSGCPGQESCQIMLASEALGSGGTGQLSSSGRGQIRTVKIWALPSGPQKAYCVSMSNAKLSGLVVWPSACITAGLSRATCWEVLGSRNGWLPSFTHPVTRPPLGGGAPSSLSLLLPLVSLPVPGAGLHLPPRSPRGSLPSRGASPLGWGLLGCT